jgi:hypothetical protein
MKTYFAFVVLLSAMAAACSAGDPSISSEPSESSEPSRTSPTVSHDFRICPDIYLPVCGANGVTYTNACWAGSEPIVFHGPCPTYGQPCGGEASPVCANGLACVESDGGGSPTLCL